MASTEFLSKAVVLGLALLLKLKNGRLLTFHVMRHSGLLRGRTSSPFMPRETFQKAYKHPAGKLRCAFDEISLLVLESSINNYLLNIRRTVI